MADSYTIAAVNGPREWGADREHGPFHDYLLTLEGCDKPVEVTQKPQTPAPQAGARIDLDVSPHPRIEGRLKGKKPQRVGFSGGPRPEDPKRAAAIARMHSQEMALRYATVRATQGKLPDEFSLGDLFKIADKFDEDHQRARDAA